MIARDVSIRQTAAQLGVDESTLRYHLKRPSDAADGRRARATALEGWEEVVTGVLARFGDARVSADERGEERSGAARCPAHCPTRVLYDILVREFAFSGSYQAVRRYLRRTYGAPRVQAVRRVETPAGVQAQHDWFEWPGVVADEAGTLYGLIGTLSFSRATFVWVSRTTTQLAWQAGHLALFQRYGGMPLWIRLDNLKTAVASGAGPTAVFNRAFATFARTCGFQLDACRPRTGSDKGKVERQVRTDRGAFADLFIRRWDALEQLQGALDVRAGELHERRRCPVTGTSVGEALAQERPALQPVPSMHEPFDCVVARRVARYCLVSFEGRRYSVPLVWDVRLVALLASACVAVIYGDGVELARHPRHTAQRLLLTPAHYDGTATETVLAPTPLGTRARAQLAASYAALPAPDRVQRPLARYLALLGDAAGEYTEVAP